MLNVRGRPSVPHAWPEPTEDWPDPTEDWPDPPENTDDNPCQCGAVPGGYHHWECDIEICPWADEHPDDGEQLMFCGCLA